MSPVIQIERLGTQRCKVGEGPLWDVATQQLYFVDVLDQTLWRHDPATGDFSHWQMPSCIGALALSRRGDAIVALADGLHRFEFDSGRSTRLQALDDPNAEVQCNDGKVDPRGRFIVGTVPRSLHDHRPIGQALCFHPDGRCETLDDGFNITNGPSWTADGKTFYFSNSRAKTIYAYDYDPEQGRVSRKRVFADTTAFGGMPDGATVDCRDHLWVAICEGGKVVCYRPDGTVERVIDMPTPLVGSVMFGGPRLDRLYVTTLNGAALGLGFADDGLGGGLFVIDGLGTQGVPEPRFAAD